MVQTSCASCDALCRPADLKPVRVRVSGKATLYAVAVVLWCGRCRAVKFGKWKYAT